MKELEKMSYEELNTLIKNLEEEKERRKKLAKETYEDKYEILSKIQDIFNEYYSRFHELPFVKYGANQPIQMDADILTNDDFMYPCLFFYRQITYIK